VREGVRDQRVGRGYSAEVVTGEFLTADPLFSGEKFLPVDCAFGSASRGRWKRRVGGLMGKGLKGVGALLGRSNRRPFPFTERGGE
jgi:hypothetical protein